MKWLLLSVLFVASFVQANDFSVTTSIGDNPTYVKGDPIQLLVTAPKDGYLYLYLVDAEQKSTLIYPNSIETNNELAAGFFMQIPALNASYQFIAAAPFGDEKVIAVLTESANENLPTEYDQLLLPRLNRQIPNALIAEVLFKVTEN